MTTDHRSEYIDTPQGFKRMGLVLFYNAVTQMGNALAQTGAKADLTTTQMKAFHQALLNMAYEK